MRIAQEEIRAHAAQLLQREESQLVEPVVHERLSLALRRQHGDKAHHVARESRPETGGDPSCGMRPRSMHAEHIAVHRAFDLHALQYRGNHFDVLGTRAANLDLASSHRGDDRPASRFDVVAPQLMLGAVQRSAAFHANRRRARARHSDAELLQKQTQLDDVRLAGGVTDFGHAVGGGRRKQRGLCAGHRRFIQIDRRRLQTVRRFEDVSWSRDVPRAHREQRLEMRADRAARRKVAAGRRQMRAPSARQQWTEQQDRPAQPADQRAVGLVLDDVGTAHAKRRAPNAFDMSAKIEDEPRHHLDVADARHVGQHAFFGGEEARREDRQRRVLVAFHLHRSRQALTAFNHKRRHPGPWFVVF